MAPKKKTFWKSCTLAILCPGSKAVHSVSAVQLAVSKRSNISVTIHLLRLVKKTEKEKKHLRGANLI